MNDLRKRPCFPRISPVPRAAAACFSRRHAPCRLRWIHHAIRRPNRNHSFALQCLEKRTSESPIGRNFAHKFCREGEMIDAIDHGIILTAPLTPDTRVLVRRVFLLEGERPVAPIRAPHAVNARSSRRAKAIGRLRLWHDGTSRLPTTGCLLPLRPQYSIRTSRLLAAAPSLPDDGLVLATSISKHGQRKILPAKLSPRRGEARP